MFLMFLEKGEKAQKKALENRYLKRRMNLRRAGGSIFDVEGGQVIAQIFDHVIVVGNRAVQLPGKAAVEDIDDHDAVLGRIRQLLGVAVAVDILEGHIDSRVDLRRVLVVALMIEEGEIDENAEDQKSQCVLEGE